MVPQAYGLKTMSLPAIWPNTIKHFRKIWLGAWCKCSKKAVWSVKHSFGGKKSRLCNYCGLDSTLSCPARVQTLCPSPLVRYSNIPEERLPAIPNAAVVCALFKPSVTETLLQLHLTLQLHQPGESQLYEYGLAPLC